ncbi:MAG: hypothetical protein ACOCRX_10250, partial [Candidatus Woesearchaeota archaeon]
KNLDRQFRVMAEQNLLIEMNKAFKYEIKRLFKRAIAKDLAKADKLKLIKELDEIFNNLMVTNQPRDFLSALDLIKFIIKEVIVDADN